jgi:hypothetical protein
MFQGAAIGSFMLPQKHICDNFKGPRFKRLLKKQWLVADRDADRQCITLMFKYFLP